MEDTHWELDFFVIILLVVLILVLMEDTHWVKQGLATVSSVCLNPCFNGRYSLRKNVNVVPQENYVLILVLMEDTHWENK